MTAFGQVPAKLLPPRDELRTVEGDVVLLTPVRPLCVEAETQERLACARAVCFEPGSIGPNRPDRPFEVSPA